MMRSQASTLAESLEVGGKSRGQKKTPYNLNTAHGAVTVAAMSEKNLKLGA
jgi:hypothetical protein